MKIYIVIYYCNDVDAFLNARVFADRDNATRYAKLLDKDNVEIKEYETDDNNDIQPVRYVGDNCDED